MRQILNFINDFRDKGAKPLKSKVKVLEIPSILLFIVTTFLSVFEKSQEIMRMFIGSYSNFILNSLIVLSIILSIKVVSQKIKKGKKYYYKFDQVSRTISKVSFILLIIITTCLIYKSLTYYLPLSKEISGYIVCNDGTPIKNVQVKIFNEKGKDICPNGSWYTDNSGMFYIFCENSIYKFYSLKILSPYKNEFISISLKDYPKLKIEESDEIISKTSYCN